MIVPTPSVRKSNTINSTFSIKDIYDISKQRFDVDKYEAVMTSYFKHSIGYLLQGNDLKLGSRLGHIKVRKEKTDFIVREGGKVLTNCYVDVRATKTINKDKDPFAPLKVIRHTEMDYVLDATWDKGIFNNVRTYYFKPSRTLRKTMFYMAKDGDISEINELHKNRKFNREDK